MRAVQAYPTTPMAGQVRALWRESRNCLRMLSQPSTHQKQSRKPTDFLLDLPQDYVEELLQERGPRGRGLSRDSITHPYHVLLSRCKDTNIFCTPSSLLNNSASTLGFPVKPGMTEGKAGTHAKRELRPEEMTVCGQGLFLGFRPCPLELRHTSV